MAVATELPGQLALLLAKERRAAELSLLVRLGGTGARSGVVNEQPNARSEPGPPPSSLATPATATPSTAPLRSAIPTGGNECWISENCAVHPVAPALLSLDSVLGPTLSAADCANRVGIDASSCGLDDSRSEDIRRASDACTVGGLVLQVLDLTWNSCGHACALEVLDLVRRAASLKAAAFEGNSFGGRPGVGAVLDVAFRAGAVVHVGVSLVESADVHAPPGVTSDAVHAVALSASAAPQSPAVAMAALNQPPRVRLGPSLPVQGGVRGGGAVPPARLPSGPPPPHDHTFDAVLAAQVCAWETCVVLASSVMPKFREGIGWEP